MLHQMILWGGFNLLILALLALDLGVLQRRPHAIRLREALWWSAFWIALALFFNLAVYFWRGPEAGLNFFTAYLLEKSLSLDNIFVFLMILSYFAVPSEYQHKVLFWGVAGALVMRGLFIALGVTLLHLFHWVIYLFGLFLVITGIKLAWRSGETVEPEKNPLLRLCRKCLPFTAGYRGGAFWVREEGRRLFTPLFVVLLVIETTDVMFAVDSIPAVLAISRDPFIVYSSNVFAILGLRALFFALAGVLKLFCYLNYGLGVILAFVGVKMLIEDWYPIPVSAALGAICGILALTIAASLLYPSKEKKPTE